jgi:hypothetical protein
MTPRCRIEVLHLPTGKEFFSDSSTDPKRIEEMREEVKAAARGTLAFLGLSDVAAGAVTYINSDVLKQCTVTLRNINA